MKFEHMHGNSLAEFRQSPVPVCQTIIFQNMLSSFYSSKALEIIVLK